jgi:hypothetical protein
VSYIYNGASYIHIGVSYTHIGVSYIHTGVSYFHTGVSYIYIEVSYIYSPYVSTDYNLVAFSAAVSAEQRICSQTELLLIQRKVRNVTA